MTNGKNMTSTQQSSSKRKPRRPFGLTLAILGGVLLFFLIPMLEIGLIVMIESTFVAEVGVGMAGVNVSGIASTALILQVSLSVLYLLIALITFSGRVARMRLVFQVFTIGLALLHIVVRIFPELTRPQNVSQGIDSAQQFAHFYLLANFWMMLFIAVYTLWFLNRWSVLAFFRGYYTPQDEEHIAKLYQN
jgi:hypothetical protein